MNQAVLKTPTRQDRSSTGHFSEFCETAVVVTVWMSYCSSFQILMSVQMALLSVTVNPLVSTCPAGTTVSAAMATMTTACLPPTGSHV